MGGSSGGRALRKTALHGVLFLGAALPAVLAASNPAFAAPRVLLAGTQVDDASANNDGWLEPGETVALRIELYNDGDTSASALTGALTYLGAAPDVSVLNGSGSWPDLAAKGVPAFSVPPGFQVTLGAALPCGAVLPFRLVVTSGSGGPFVLDFSLKASQRIDHDMKRDSLRRFTDQETLFQGAQPFDGLGASVAWGDVNGDGYADMILGAPLSDSVGNSRLDAGAVYLIYGGPAQWNDADLSTSPPDAVRFWGSNAGDSLGGAVAAGDVNGDGFDDLILGAPASDSVGKARAGAGEIYLVYGKAARFADTDLLTPPAGAVRIQGADPSDAVGSAIAAGDVNHDGFDDLLVAAPGADSIGNGRADAGEVYLIYGQAAAWSDADLASTSSGVARLWGADQGDSLGRSVAAGDVNGDGFADLIVGAGGSNSLAGSRPGAGAFYLVYGGNTPLGDVDLSAPPAGVARFWGARPADGLGAAVAAGDVNGDGFGDLLAGAPGAATMGGARPGAGEAWILFGGAAAWGDTDLASPPAGAARVYGADPFDGLGSSLASGDVNGDGYEDLILGAPGAASTGNGRTGAGEVAVVLGEGTAWTDVDLSIPSPGVSFFSGAYDGDGLGISVASGDLNGDGYRDLILGARSAGSTGGARAQAGEADLWYGKPTDTWLARSDSFGFIDASTGTKLPLDCDDCSVALPLGFAFPFYGETFSSLYVGSNGLLSFGPMDDAASAFPACMPARTPNRLLIAPYWDDLNPAVGAPGSGVFAFLQGAAPNRRVTIEWKDLPHKINVGAATFEATLFESTGQILFQYQDVTFGSASFDGGAAAVVGVGNRTGAHGVAVSCFANDVVQSGTSLRLVPGTPLVENRSEGGLGLWSASGLWHPEGAACEVNQHTGTAGWYYGQDATCDYADPNAPVNSGSLGLPQIPSLPADARIAYWSRRQTDGKSGFDLSEVQISTAGPGGPYAVLQQASDVGGAWRYSGVTNIFGAGGATADLRFHFDTVDAVSNDHLGWMVDDIQVTGCNASGAAGASARAEAYAASSVICQGNSGFVDALGSFCGDSGIPSSFQWKENGIDIPGAASGSYVIPAGKPLGTYDYTVSIGCPGGGSSLSPPAVVGVVSTPTGPVGPSLRLAHADGFASLHFTWTDVGSATDYVVLESPTKNGPFTTVTGTAPSGAAGLTVPVTAGDIVYYLVNGRCSSGPGP